MINQTRSRWAAIGAAIAVTLGAGGIGITHATTDSGPMPIFKTLDAPCRLADTRPAPNTVGPRTTGIGPAETYDLDGWGTVGDCTLPSDTASLELNVTAVGATQQTNLRFFPKGVALPTTANLNPSPGASPTPNSVTVGLNATDGQFSVYNAFGTVAVIIDVIGYYDDHIHTGDDIVDGSLTDVDIRNEAGVASSFSTASTTLDNTIQRVGSSSIRVPSDGHIIVEVSGIYSTSGAGASTAWCQITLGDVPGSLAILSDTQPWTVLSDQGSTISTSDGFSTHRVLEISADDNPKLFNFGQVFGLDCLEVTGAVSVSNVHISATFVPTSYEPIGLIVILDEDE